MTQGEQNAAVQVAMAYLQVDKARRSARLAWALNVAMTLYVIFR